MKDDIILLLLGWAFGLVTVVISDIWRNWNESEITRPALLEELHELRHRLVHHVFLIEHKHGTIDHDFIQWAHDTLKQYKGTNVDSIDSLIKSISTLLNLPEEDLIKATQVSKSQKNPRKQTGLRKHTLPMLEANMNIVRTFDPILRGKILDIKTRIGFLNELIDEARYFFKLSFETGISSENYEIAEQNLTDTYKFYSDRARNIVDLIGDIPEK